MKKSFLKSNQIFPPYLVPYKDAMYQDHFDIDYIRKEIQEDKELSRRIEQRRLESERMQSKSVNPPSISKEIHKGIQVTDITAEINKTDKGDVNGQSFQATDDDWFDDW
ncbi:hypothetical protein SAMN05518672_102802 [Chitinophaga sp. CF118]|uniref:hypothetical protein n=1 Tax=Chitinophaga sp. CF118 TaxID=1884367 RepID=UPI0008EFDC27|nr:hypothetical protein [Chitinophaga sp. CF118]SFD65253.1 hypothetical protein SAMN05518672_102802 [Chitinophaga sp. CF118]